MAAVLASLGSVLSHRSAAALWELLPPEAGSTHVTLPAAGGRPNQPGIWVHRSSTLTAPLTTRRKGIPVTTPARTIADLRAVVPRQELRRAIRQAEYLGLAIDDVREADRTRSELERRFLRLCGRHRLPKPQVNHRGRQAFEDDRARDAELALRGYRVIRLTHRQLLEDPARAMAVLGDLLSVAPRL